jgi:spermidine/putrescine transport system ATP-binding protein
MNGDAASSIGALGARVVFDRIEKQYGPVTAVDDVSLDIGPGEFVTLLGPSGSGKTTTLMMLAGFEIPTAGEIYVDDDPIAAVPPYRRNIGMVFQNYALFPHMNVGQNVAYGLAMKRVPKTERVRRVAEALEMVRLPHVEKRKPSALSGGQQQRVALARALVNRPAVLLLDEPLGALDLKLRKAMQLELKALNREIGATFVYVTHDQEEALTMSDRIAVMSDGRILQIGSPAEIYERPRSRFVADFIGQTNFLSGRLVRRSEGVTEVEITGSGVVRAVSAPGEASDHPEQVTIAVRPERTQLVDGADPTGGLNVLSGLVREVIYLGTHSQYVVQLPAGETVVVHRQNSAGVETGGPNAGDAVRLAFAPAAATVLTD